MDKLKDLKKSLVESLENFAERGVTNDTELKRADMMAHLLKNLDKVIEKREEEEQQGSSYRMPRRVYASEDGRDMQRVGGYVDNAYRRRRDSMGRYSREDRGGSSYDDGYAEASNEMRNLLDSMLRDAGDDKERKVIREMMSELNIRG